jgi:hypothetical protein
VEQEHPKGFRIKTMKRLCLVLTVGLAACAGLPLRLGIENISLTVPLVLYTNNNVIYPKNPSSFSQPPVNISSVRLEGKAKASNVVSDVNVFLYARVASPATDPTCTTYTDIIVCPKAGQIKINSSPMTLLSSGSLREFVFDDASQVLRDGVNAGKMWFGLEVTSGAAANMNLQLSELVASVTVL